MPPFETIFARQPLPSWVFDLATLRFLEVNEAAVREYGFSRDEFLAMTILDIRPARQRPRVLVDLSAAPLPADADVPTWLHRRKDGSVMEVRVHAAGIEFDGRPARLIVTEDVTAELAAQRKLAYRATHDGDTGLWNAAALADAVTGWSKPSRIACIQLHGLELLEDSLGAPAREQALRAVAERLRELAARYGAAGRLRDDEFALALRSPDSWPQASAELRQAMSLPIEDGDSAPQLNAWIGTVDVPADAAEAGQAITLGRIAAHTARTEGKPVVAFDPAMARHAQERLAIAAGIRRALEREEFGLVYQPIRRIEDGTTVGLEALLRWPRAGGPGISPAEFIPVSEDTGLIVPLGQWVLRQAALACGRLDAAGLGAVTVAVNVSHVQVASDDFAAGVARLFDEFGLARGALHIELTESVLMKRAEQTREVLQELHECGICISLDDFGTGFSNMSYLQHLPIDALKIDRSFVQDVDTDERNAFICRALIALGHGLGLQVVAEGVETSDQYDWLRRHGCDQAQGFGLGRPAPLAEVIEALAAA